MQKADREVSSTTKRVRTGEPQGHRDTQTQTPHRDLQGHADADTTQYSTKPVIVTETKEHDGSTGFLVHTKRSPHKRPWSLS